MCEIDSFSKFPICLSIKLISSYKDSAILLTGAKYYHISRYALIWFDFNDLTHLQIGAGYFTGACFLYESVDLLVCLFITSFTIVVVIGLLEESEAEN